MNASVRDIQRQKAESAYRELLSRLQDVPGIDLKEAFNKTSARDGMSVNELFAAAGYTPKQRQQLMDTLSYAQHFELALESGDLTRAERNLDKFKTSLEPLRQGGLLSDQQLRTIENGVEVSNGRIDSERPKVFAQAQKFFAEYIANGDIGAESIEKNSRKFYDMLRDAGLSQEVAGKGYHAFQDAMEARRIQRLGMSAEAVELPLLELQQSIKFIESIKPSPLDAQNIKTLKDLETSLTGLRTLNTGTPTVVEIGLTDSVPKEYRVDPALLREAALKQVEKMQAILDWRDSKNGVTHLGAIYGQPMAVMEQRALPNLRKALEAKGDSYEELNALYKAFKDADFQLKQVSPNYRGNDAQQIVKRLNDIGEAQYQAWDATADAIGALPVVGSRIKGAMKEVAIGLRWARGDISTSEALGSAAKEGVMAVLGDARFKDMLKDRFPKMVESGEDLLIHLGGAIVGNVRAELGKVIGNNELSEISARKITEAISVGIAKGLVEGGFKLAERYKLNSEGLEEFSKILVKLAHKFGLERPFDQYIDRELKARSDDGKSYSRLDGDALPRVIETLAESKLASTRAALEGTAIPGVAPGTNTYDNLVAALALNAEKAELRTISSVMLNNDGTRLIALDDGLNSNTSRLANVAIRDAVLQPAEDSLAHIVQLQTSRSTIETVASVEKEPSLTKNV